ncbi:hypothetical protein D3C71_1759320 [compost metagenome]
MVGMSGISVQRMGLALASMRIFPEFTWGMMSEGFCTMTSTWPPSNADTVSAPDL